MLGVFHPSFEGVWRTDNLAEDFARRLAARVRSGLLPLAKRRRNQYEIVSESDESVRFRSTTRLTGANIGWNDVDLRIDRRSGEVRYHVAYWAWTRFCVGLGLLLAALFGLAVVLPVLTGWHLFDESFYPEKGDVVNFALPMMVFWCFVWPWVLVALHKRPARRGFENLLAEVNSSAPLR